MTHPGSIDDVRPDSGGQQSDCAQWRIRWVSVRGLFGDLNHQFSINPETRRAILIGPNGVGKTKLLAILTALLNLELTVLLEEPYERVDVRFEDGSSLQCIRKHRHTSGSSELKLRLLTRGNVFTWFFSKRDLVAFDRELKARFEPQFEEFTGDRGVVERRRFWKVGSKLLTTDQLLARQLDNETQSSGLELTDEAYEIRKFLGSNRCLFIRTDRLNRDALPPARTVTRPDPGWFRSGNSVIGDHIRRELAEARFEYSRISQKLDSSFPIRLLGSTDRRSSTVVLSPEQIRARYRDLREKIASTARAAGVPDLEIADLPQRKLDDWEVRVLSLHMSDLLQKTASLERVSRRIDVFEGLVNRKLVRSRIKVGPRGLQLQHGHGKPLKVQPASLSSGERHQLQLAFDLVFRSDNKNLVLVDEPEISLHVNWQNKLLGDFAQLADLNGFSYVVATHSPEVIGDAWADVTPLTMD